MLNLWHTCQHTLYTCLHQLSLADYLSIQKNEPKFHEVENIIVAHPPDSLVSVIPVIPVRKSSSMSVYVYKVKMLPEY